MSSHSSPGSTAAALILLLACAPTLRAQGAGSPAPAPPAPPARSVAPADRELVREVARTQQARAELVGRIDALVQKLEAGDDLSPTDRRRLQVELDAALKRLTETHARVGVDVGTRLVFQRQPGVATGEMRRVVGEAQRRFATAARTGYLGITLSPTTNLVRVLDDGALFVRYAEHPFIMSVEPGSPAERAGLQRGDTVLTYDGVDVRREIPMHEVLEPGRQVRIGVQRDGRQRTVSLTVAQSPAIVRGRREEFFAPVRPLTPAPTARGGRRAVASPPDAESAVAPALRPTRAADARVAFRLDLPRGIAGAEMTPVTPGLARALGVTRGLLVTTVAPRSPAAASGLRDGDVVLTANGREVTEIPDLGRIMRESEAARTVTLELQRERKKRTVRLTW